MGHFKNQKKVTKAHDLKTQVRLEHTWFLHHGSHQLGNKDSMQIELAERLPSLALSNNGWSRTYKKQ